VRVNAAKTGDTLPPPKGSPLAVPDCTPLIRFGVFQLDVRAGELRKSGRKIRLQEQPFQILWSPDGNRITFESSKEAQKTIYVIDRDGKSLRRVTTDRFANGRPSWSKDGAWIYFGSDRSGTWQVWKAPARGGQPVQVTMNGGREAFESPDGKYVYYAKTEGVAGIWRVPVEGGEETLVLNRGTMNHWTVMEQGMCFLDPDAKPPVIQFFDIATRRLTTVAVLPKDGVPAGGWGFPAIAVSPDARTILYVQAARTESHIQLVKNFR